MSDGEQLSLFPAGEYYRRREWVDDDPDSDEGLLAYHFDLRPRSQRPLRVIRQVELIYLPGDGPGPI